MRGLVATKAMPRAPQHSMALADYLQTKRFCLKALTIANSSHYGGRSNSRPVAPKWRRGPHSIVLLEKLCKNTQLLPYAVAQSLQKRGSLRCRRFNISESRTIMIFEDTTKYEFIVTGSKDHRQPRSVGHQN